MLDLKVMIRIEERQIEFVVFLFAIICIRHILNELDTKRLYKRLQRASIVVPFDHYCNF